MHVYIYIYIVISYLSSIYFFVDVVICCLPFLPSHTITIVLPEVDHLDFVLVLVHEVRSWKTVRNSSWSKARNRVNSKKMGWTPCKSYNPDWECPIFWNCKVEYELQGESVKDLLVGFTFCENVQSFGNVTTWASQKLYPILGASQLEVAICNQTWKKENPPCIKGECSH